MKSKNAKKGSKNDKVEYWLKRVMNGEEQVKQY